MSDTARFGVNTTIGIVGIFDVATRMGLVGHDEDFGQTLGKWGVGEGWFIVLPILGPSDNRDVVGRFGDSFVNPINYLPWEYHLPGLILYTIDKRSQLLEADRLLYESFDPYLFVRSAYLQRRQSLIYDGSPPPEKDVDTQDET